MADNDIPVGGVTVEIRAPLDKLNADYRAAEAATRQTDATMSAAWKNSEGATVSLARAQLALIDSFNKTGKASVEMARDVGGAAEVQRILANSAKVAAEAQKTLAAAMTAEAAPAARKWAESLKDAGGYFQRLNPLVQEGEKQLKGHAIATSTVTRELITMGREIGRGNFSRLAGSSTILAQALGLLAPEMIAVTGGVVAVAGALVAGVVSTLQYEDAVHKASIASVGLAGASGLSAAAMMASADAASESSDITVGAARKGAEAFATAGISNRQTLDDATSSLKDYAVLTGEKMPEATKELAQALGEPARGAQELNDKFNFLTSTEKDNIETLAALGEKTDAQNLLTRDFKKYTDDANIAAGGLTSGLDKLAGGASRAWDWFGRLNAAVSQFESFGLAGLPGGTIDQQKAGASSALQTRQRNNYLAGQAADVANPLVDPDAADRNALQGRVNKLQAGLSVEADPGQRARDQTALNEELVALQHFLPAAERLHRTRQLEIADAKAKTPAEKAAVAAQKEELAMMGEAIPEWERQQRLTDAAAVASAKKTAHTKAHKDAVADETAKLKDNTAALLGEAMAYLTADAAQAQRLAAGAKADDFVITHPKANRDAMASQFLGEDVAKSGMEGAQKALDLNEQSDALKKLNDEVASGAISSKEEDRLLKEQAELRPLVVAQTNAEGDAKAALTKIIDGLTAAQARANAEAARQKILGLTDEQNGKNAETPESAGQTLRQRLLAAAQARSLQQITQAGGSAFSPAGAGLMAANTAGANKEADEGNRKFVQDQTTAINDQIKALQAQGATFGMTTAQAAAYLKYQELLNEATKEGRDPTAAQTKALQDLAKAYGDAAGAAAKLAAQQKGALEAEKSVADGLDKSLESLIFDHKRGDSIGNELKSFGRDQLKSAFHSEVTGEGPWAEMLGTAPKGPGQAGGALGGLLGPLFGLNKGAGKPDGSQGNPLHVIMAGSGAAGSAGGFPGAGGSQGPMSILSSLMPGGGSGGGGIGGILGALFKNPGGAGGLSNILGSAGSATDAESAFGTVAGLFHSGTSQVGAGMPPTRLVSPAMFLNAPRLHKGLAADEFPAILQHGEGVSARGSNGGKPAGAPSINVMLSGANGDKDIRRISAQGVAKGMQLVQNASPGERMRYNLLEG